ncbi:hypothetical protein B0H67DRAFT_658060, partial [Lasiosphaeris hirsuta]
TLPRNFQEAVTLTRDLGLKYLWIDSLCIIQDDPHDWEVESGNMAAIYKNAYVVVGADRAKIAHEEFLRQSATPENQLVGKPVAYVPHECATLYARPHFLHSNLYTDQSLSQRARNVQEQLLATRMVHFTEHEMVYECRSGGLCCECMELDQKLSGTIRRDYKLPEFARPSSPLFSSPGIVATTSMYNHWYRTANTILTRGITYPQDLLPALSGLANEFQDSDAGTYIAGV